MIDPCLYRFETVRLRQTTVRELLVRVLTEVSPNQTYSLIKADESMVTVVQHILICIVHYFYAHSSRKLYLGGT